MVIWLTGISGSGKSTIARELVTNFSRSGRQVVWVDGDDFREIFRGELSISRYSVRARKRNARRIFRLVKLLDSQGIDIVVSVLSLFPEMLGLNRQTFSKYFEVSLIASLNLVRRRDPKGLYAKNSWNLGRRVVGWGIEYVAPAEPDFEVDMDTTRFSASEIAWEIFRRVSGSKNG